MTSDEERNFLARWSQRKREAARQSEAKALEPAPDAPEEEDFDLSLLPKLEDLTPQTDLTLFFKKGVPEFLRNAALRKMWTLDPAVRDYRSEALDYAWDWNAPGGVPGGGDLPADFDSSEMVARIFGDEPVDENVIKESAVQQSRLAGAENTPEGETTPPTSPENSENNEEKQSFDSLPPVASRNDAPPKRQRHGSALPLSKQSV